MLGGGGALIATYTHDKDTPAAQAPPFRIRTVSVTKKLDGLKNKAEGTYPAISGIQNKNTQSRAKELLRKTLEKKWKDSTSE